MYPQRSISHPVAATDSAHHRIFIRALDRVLKKCFRMQVKNVII